MRKDKERGCYMKKHELTWSYVSARLLGAGVYERGCDTSGLAWRVMLPDPYLDPDKGFPDLIDGPWIMTFRDIDFLVALPLGLWPEFLGRLRHELCEVGNLSAKSFKLLHEDRARKIWKDSRNRWSIDQHLTRYLHPGEDDSCTLVLQTREATVEIRTRSRYHCDQLKAEQEAEQLREKADSTVSPPEIPSVRGMS